MGDINAVQLRQIEVYRRDDSKFAFRARALNNDIVATDGGQGYEQWQDAVHTARFTFAAGVPILTLEDNGGVRAEGVTGSL